ncbi:MAG: nucleoside triphosphate pyrophosphohydrolase [Thermodesulfobacteriota bacterium]|nr:nucleoside triphosphate pyrophosphohydrolase [Thermodesulfobacteriota bacterium]
MSHLDVLLSIVKQLRSDDGCSWDRKQTIESLTPLLIEESYELVDAIENGCFSSIKEELGDLLFHIIFISEIASEQGKFALSDVVTSITKKMITRHPHVFDRKRITSKTEPLKSWVHTKYKESQYNLGSILDDIPHALPALLMSHKVYKIVSAVGFDWDTSEGVIEKIYEEISELKDALASQDSEKIILELGDILFSVANLCAFLGVNGEDTLKKANKKFIKRFKYIEDALKSKGKDIFQSNIKEMDELWNEAKKSIL